MSFEEILQRALDKPVPVKGKEGVTLSAMEAMVNALMNNAMKGDIASIAFINNMTKVHDVEREEKALEAHTKRLEERCQELREMLECENNYFKQDEEIKQLAEIALLVDKLSLAIAAPDFEEVITDLRSGKQQISAVITLRDQQKDRFDKLLEKIRDEALRRKIGET